MSEALLPPQPTPETDYRNSKAGARRFKYKRFYRLTVWIQTILWKLGIPWHNSFSGECTPDFNCCTRATLRIQQLESDLRNAHLAIAHNRQMAADYGAEADRLRKALLNKTGDDLCWFQHTDKGKIPTAAEFLESCKRFHAQISSERGELRGCRTIAQLEQAIVTLEEEKEALEARQTQSKAIELLPGEVGVPFFKSDEEYQAFRDWWKENVTEALKRGNAERNQLSAENEKLRAEIERLRMP